MQHTLDITCSSPSCSYCRSFDAACAMCLDARVVIAGCDADGPRIPCPDCSPVDPHGVWSPREFAHAMETALTKSLAEERAAAAKTNRKAARAAARAQAPTDAGIDAHRLDASPSIQLADWYSDAPLVDGESNVATLMVPDGDDAPYEIETWKVLDDAATVQYLQRDEAPYRVAWSEQDERRYVLGRLRWQVQTLARKHRIRSSVAVTRFPAARAAAQQARALKARWNFQHELTRAGAEPSPEVTRWCKAAFGRTFETALAEIRSARVASNRQPFAAVRAGLI